MNTDLAVLCCICVGGLISTGIGCLFGALVFDRPWGSRLIETIGHPTGLPFSSVSFSLPEFINRGQLLLSIGWVQLSASDSFSCLLGLSECSHASSFFCEGSIGLQFNCTTSIVLCNIPTILHLWTPVGLAVPCRNWGCSIFQDYAQGWDTGWGCTSCYLSFYCEVRS